VDEPAQPIFYYDLGSPGCYLVAERIMSELPVVPEWEPVLGTELGVPEDHPDPEQLARAIDDAGLQPLRLPASWPPNSELAMLVATYAKHVGRAVAYSQAAFRQAFAGGRDLGDEGTVLIAGAACEMHPTALLKAVTLRSVTTGLRTANDRARAAGVTALPAIQIADQVFCGDDALELATSRLTAIASGTR
jgi:2-hydroxychromene-2-carboxylate isomerase